MQDKRYSNSAVDLCFMLVTTPPARPPRMAAHRQVRNTGDLLRELRLMLSHLVQIPQYSDHREAQDRALRRLEQTEYRSACRQGVGPSTVQH